jgi:hypothetical protein
MAIASYDKRLLALLKELGMPDHCTRFTLTAEIGAAVTATATYYPTLDLDPDGKLTELTKRYRLVEIPNDNDTRDG